MRIKYIQKLSQEQAEALQERLKVNFMPNEIWCEITFTATKYLPATRIHPAEGGELDVSSVEILYITSDQDEVPIMVNNVQRLIIADFLDDDAIETACWEELERVSSGYDDYDIE